MPVGKQQVIIERRLLAHPHVERFVHHEKAHLVGELQQFRRGRIVAGANGVAAHFLKHFELPLQRSYIDGRAQGAQDRDDRRRR